MNNNIWIIPVIDKYLSFPADPDRTKCTFTTEKYLGFPANTDPDLAKRTFTARFGYPPEKVEQVPNNLLVGPVKEIEE